LFKFLHFDFVAAISYFIILKDRRHQKELLGKEDGCSLGSGKNFQMGRRGTPREGKSPPRKYVPKGGVKLWLGMHYVPKKKVPRDWM
jgi:hypothetical protein